MKYQYRMKRRFFVPGYKIQFSRDGVNWYWIAMFKQLSDASAFLDQREKRA